MGYGLNIGTGTFYGDGGYGSSLSGSTGLGQHRRATSSSNFRTMSRNIAAGYSSDMEIIQKYLEDGKTDKAIEKYESLFNDIKATTGNYNYQLTDAEIQSILKSSYEATTGASVIDSVEENTCGSFMTGFKQSIPILGLFCNDTSEAEAIAKLTGDEVSFKDKALEFLGMAVGTVAFWWLGGPIGKGIQTAAGTIKGLGFAAKLATNFPKTAKFLGVVANHSSEIIKGATAVSAVVSGVDEATDGIKNEIA
ncbi:MAG: hypothetical protein IJB79_04255 [Candidatus Gastranaerophilales bacterium]|nr:hypothetical protein [Candidatus Gastranaerophilales bacterium]